MAREIILDWESNDSQLQGTLDKFREINREIAKASKQMDDLNDEMKRTARVNMDEGIRDAKNEASSLAEEVREVRAEMAKVHLSDTGFEKAKRQAKDMKEEVKSAKKSTDGLASSMSSIGGGISKISAGFSALKGGIGAVLEGAMAVGRVLSDVSMKIIDAAGNTQKHTTNLELMMGSAEDAEQAFLALNDIATKTPFSLDEVAESYIKLARRGMAPTKEQLILLGDLASASGKGMLQLSEAILDAQQGDKTRLKEFGIEMEASGGKIRLSLGKAVVEGETMIETFSKLASMPGIGGAMIKQSETFGGMISTIKDVWSNMLAAIGNSPEVLEPVKNALATMTDIFSGIIRSMSVFITLAKGAFKPMLDRIEQSFGGLIPTGDLVEAVINALVQAFRYMSAIINTYITPAVSVILDAWDELMKSFTDGNGILNILLTILLDVADYLIAIVINASRTAVAILKIINAVWSWITSFESVQKVIKDVIVTLRVLMAVAKIVQEGIIRIYTSIAEAFSAIMSGNWDEAKRVFKKNFRDYVATAEKEIENAVKGNKLQLPARPEEEADKGKGSLPGNTDQKPRQGDEDDEKRRKEKATKEAQNLELALLKQAHEKRMIAIAEAAEREKDASAKYESQKIKEQEDFLAKSYKIRQKYEKLTEADDVNHKTELIKQQAAYEASIRKQELEASGKDLELQKAYFDREIAETQAHYKTLIDMQKKKDELLKTNSYVASISQMELVQQGLLAEEEIIREKYARMLESTLLTEEEHRDIIDKSNREIAAIEMKYADQQREINHARAKGLRDIENAYNDISKKAIESASKAVEGMGALGKSTAGIFNTFRDTAERISKMKELKKAAEQLGTDAGKALAEKMQKQIENAQIEKSLQVAAQAIEGIVGLLGDINSARIAAIDEEIKKNNEEIEQLEKMAELERERNDELANRQAIINVLAENRIKELDDLKNQVPEAEKERVEKSIAFEQGRIQDIDRMRENAKSKEESRIKELQKANEDAEKRKQSLMREGFEIERAGKIASTVISGALAVVQAFAQLGPVAGAVAAGVITALTAVQVGLIAAEPNPYKEGTLSVEGNIRDRDSVLSILQPGEAVIPVETNQKYADAVAAIYNRQVPANILNDFVKNYRMRGIEDYIGQGVGGSVSVVSGYDTDRIVSAIESKPSLDVSIDEDGFAAWIAKKDEKTRIRNRKLRIRH